MTIPHHIPKRLDPSDHVSRLTIVPSERVIADLAIKYIELLDNAKDEPFSLQSSEDITNTFTLLAKTCRIYKKGKAK